MVNAECLADGHVWLPISGDLNRDLWRCARCGLTQRHLPADANPPAPATADTVRVIQPRLF